MGGLGVPMRPGQRQLLARQENQKGLRQRPYVSRAGVRGVGALPHFGRQVVNRPEFPAVLGERVLLRCTRPKSLTTHRSPSRNRLSGLISRCPTLGCQRSECRGDLGHGRDHFSWRRVVPQGFPDRDRHRHHVRDRPPRSSEMQLSRTGRMPGTSGCARRDRTSSRKRPSRYLPERPPRPRSLMAPVLPSSPLTLQTSPFPPLPSGLRPAVTHCPNRGPRTDRSHALSLPYPGKARCGLRPGTLGGHPLMDGGQFGLDRSLALVTLASRPPT